MDTDEFRKRGKEMIDYVADYLENIRDRRPQPDVEPGYLHKLIPAEAPQNAEKWETVFSDIEKVIMPGISHWQNPHFHAYFCANHSYEATIADILSNSIGCIGFTWASSPACTELEVVMMDWLGKMLKLPQAFLSGGKGGGVIQNSACEATLVALLAARNKVLQKYRSQNSDLTHGEIMQRLVCYTSDQAHSSIERACLIGSVKFHQVDSDDACCMRGEALWARIKEDKKNGLIPFYCVATLGTTSSCAFDKVLEIGPVCQEEDIWLHIDAAYAGSSFICPEYRPLLDGVEFADSFVFNPHKLMLVNLDCSAQWFKDTTHLMEALNVDFLIFEHDHQGKVPDYMHWQISMSRRFRSLKLWFVLRLIGINDIQAHIHKHISLAYEFKAMVNSDPLFEVTNEVKMGLVCFRLKGISNEVNEKLLNQINKDGRIHMIPSKAKDIYFLRFAVGSPMSTSDDIAYAWKVIIEVTNSILQINGINPQATITHL